ncbi:MAG: aminotransferase class I/II-fold pyridoxal phosphate-dependent enzyme [Candidatus Gastranaerophilales bacterium]|nr:aminotransferase class I/II-fold pyridoxal phosphate-dependent enzyme [Candidatus Gastranaerophilales bacterium]
MPDIKALYSDYVKTLETYIMFKIAQDTNRLRPELEAKGRPPIMLSIGAPTQNPPQYVIDALTKSMDEKGIHSYSVPKGEAFYLEAVKHRMKKRFGVDVNPVDEIFSLIGSKEGLSAMFRTLINPSLDIHNQDIIMIPDPGYASYKEQIKTSGGHAYSIPLTPENNYMPDPYELLAQLEKEGFNPEKVKAFVINYPNNPLGASATDEYLKKVVDFCYEKNILLVSDAAYADMYFEGEQPPRSILEFDKAKDIAIEFHSLSKPYAMTGWRIGWACGNKDAVAVLGKLKSTIDTGLYKAVQKAAAEILTAKEGDDYINEVNKIYEKKQQIAVKGFKELGWEIDNSTVPRYTFYLWLPIPRKYNTAEEFTSALLETSGIVAVPGTAFGKYGEGFFRVSIVATEENLYEVFERMKKDGFYY